MQRLQATGIHWIDLEVEAHWRLGMKKNVHRKPSG